MLIVAEIAGGVVALAGLLLAGVLLAEGLLPTPHRHHGTPRRRY